MQFVHTAIASRASLHILNHKVDLLVHKGFFDARDKEGLKFAVTSRIEELQATIARKDSELAELQQDMEKAKAARAMRLAAAKAAAGEGKD